MEKIRKDLSLDNIFEKLYQNYLGIEQLKTGIEIFYQKFLGTTDKNNDDDPTLIKLEKQIENIKTKLDVLIITSELTPLVEKIDKTDKDLIKNIQSIQLKLSTIDDELAKLQINAKTVETGIDYLKVLTREPLDQSKTHKDLKEILKQVQLLNIEELNHQLAKVFKETIGQTDFQYAFANAVKIELRDRLIKIQEDLKHLATIKPLATTPGSQSNAIINTTEHFFIYTDRQSPDVNHFLL